MRLQVIRAVYVICCAPQAKLHLCIANTAKKMSGQVLTSNRLLRNMGTGIPDGPVTSVHVEIHPLKGRKKTTLSDKEAGKVKQLPSTREQIFNAAERLFAQHGFQKVTVRDISAEAGVNLASMNYHFGAKNDLANEIFRKRSTELNRDRMQMLQEAMARHDGKPSVREVLAALYAPPLQWLQADDWRRTAIQVILRARTEGTKEMRDALRKHVSHLERFASALKAACPQLAEETIYWRLHFCLGLVHNNRVAEFERLNLLSKGLTRDFDADSLLKEMLDFSVAGFMA